MNFGAMVARFLGRRERKPRPATRLTDTEALAIARSVARLTSILVLDVEPRGETVVWVVGTRNKGANERVEIDDETGRILLHRYFGGR